MVEKLSAEEHTVKVFREYRNLTQSELAKKINVSKQYISQIEKFERKDTTKFFKNIAQALKVELADLGDK